MLPYCLMVNGRKDWYGKCMLSAKSFVFVCLDLILGRTGFLTSLHYGHSVGVLKEGASGTQNCETEWDALENIFLTEF